MRVIEFLNNCAEIAENMTTTRRPGNYYREPDQSESTPLGEINLDFNLLHPAPVINRHSFFASRDSVPSDAPIGTMYLNGSTDRLMVMTESGFVRVEGTENFEDPVGISVTGSEYEMWHPPVGFHNNTRILNIGKDHTYEDLDELYVVDEVQKSKKLGYLFLKDVDKLHIDSHPIKIKYFEWCYRSNMPYLVAYRNSFVNSIELYLNPRNVYIGRVFNSCAHDYIIKLFKHYNNGGRIFYTEETYKLYNILPYRTIEILPKIVNLFRNNDNLNVDY